MARRCGARCPPVHAAEPVRRTVVRIAPVIAVTLVATLCFAAVSARAITGAESISTIAGTGMAGYNGDGIAPPGAQLNWPNSVLRAPNGDTYIADTFGQRVRKVDADTGRISTVAGTGVLGYNGDGIPATSAQLHVLSISSAGSVAAQRDGAAAPERRRREERQAQPYTQRSGRESPQAPAGAALGNL